MSCTIDNQTSPINSMAEGLRSALKGDIEKNSEVLGRDAVWSKETKVNRLPQYLCVQFVRFYWKQASGVAGTDAGKAKILRNVAFPKVFDMFEFCTDELKASLMHGRDLEAKNRAKEDAAALGGTEEEKKSEETKNGADIEMKEESKEEENSNQAQKQLVGAAAKAARV